MAEGITELLVSLNTAHELGIESMNIVKNRYSLEKHIELIEKTYMLTLKGEKNEKYIDCNARP